MPEPKMTTQRPIDTSAWKALQRTTPRSRTPNYGSFSPKTHSVVHG